MLDAEAVHLVAVSEKEVALSKFAPLVARVETLDLSEERSPLRSLRALDFWDKEVFSVLMRFC